MLNETVFRSEDVPPADRFGYWAERLRKTHAPVTLSSKHTHDFRFTQRVLDLGSVSLWPATFEQVTIRRTPKLIRQSDPELYHMSLVVMGTGAGTWDDGEATYRPSDLHINDSAVPWEIRTGAEPVTALGLEIPKALLPLPRAVSGRPLPRLVTSREGTGALLCDLLTRLASHPDQFQPSDGPRLGTAVTHLVAALFAHLLEAEKSLPPETHQRALILRVKNFIRRHMHDPQLTPSVVAAAHHISVSYLHRLFQEEEITVAAWIRRLRLEAACRDLADPALGDVPIHVIGTRWGFPRAAEFSRAFRSAYGMPPRDYRHLSQTSPAL
ncbi:helix-turn-helix domain-containing protein [Streptomyces sp. CG4]|uniref:helix-turn-helix domain-containing protein n=1 Tax=Streptomyces sp. CG4 TaxID=408783 RepID=UPI0034E27A87